MIQLKSVVGVCAVAVFSLGFVSGCGSETSQKKQDSAKVSIFGLGQDKCSPEDWVGTYAVDFDQCRGESALINGESEHKIVIKADGLGGIKVTHLSNGLSMDFFDERYTQEKRDSGCRYVAADWKILGFGNYRQISLDKKRGVVSLHDKNPATALGKVDLECQLTKLPEVEEAVENR